MKTEDKILLRKRAIIETINDELKTIARWNTPDIEV
nr:transposase [Chryseobacterium piperi]